jgi:hypothetical protein
MPPRYPITVTFHDDGEVCTLDNEAEAASTLEWFDSEDPEWNGTVVDSDGRPVRIKVEAHRMVEFLIRSDPRGRVAQILTHVAEGRISARQALDEFRSPELSANDVVIEAYHFLQHFEIDADIRAKDVAYAARQVEALHAWAARLRSLAGG